ncbi:hypothetical protein [Chloroflexus aggregans]|uniref:DUF454 domain-containing protein n=1 Tax=Chloroflexus aggregans (strain MD-66 / DSM 9485) TaxID=326427 RepID=B8G599_CHLAD|nr:hypothetical protein [Chloroflexus aggregans]ACL25605.1 conserved hypothetical protein [Chloroflexus aggregans DSM 9485]
MLAVIRFLRSNPSVRRILGLTFLIIGIIGSLFPIIPGWPGFLMAIIFLGRRDRLLRRLHLIARLVLRWLRKAPVPHVRGAGQWLSNQYVELRRAVVPHLIAFERHLDGPNPL